MPTLVPAGIEGSPCISRPLEDTIRENLVGFAIARRKPSLMTPEKYGSVCTSADRLSRISLRNRSYLEISAVIT